MRPFNRAAAAPFQVLRYVRQTHGVSNLLLTLFPGLFKFDHYCVSISGHYIPRDEERRTQAKQICYPLPNLWSCLRERNAS